MDMNPRKTGCKRVHETKTSLYKIQADFSSFSTRHQFQERPCGEFWGKNRAKSTVDALRHLLLRNCQQDALYGVPKPLKKQRVNRNLEMQAW